MSTATFYYMNRRILHANNRKTVFFKPGITVTCHVPVPQTAHLYVKNEEELEKRAEFIDGLIHGQVIRAIKSTIEAYKRSDLPEKYLIRQKIEIRPFHWTERAFGHFYPQLDIIEMDTDAFSIGVYGGSGKYLYGHESGHRIMNYKASKAAIEQVKALLFISSDYTATELLCDAFGILLDNDGEYDDDTIAQIAAGKREGLKRIALGLAWSC